MTTTTETKPQTASFKFCEKAGRRGTSFLHSELVAEALKISLPKPRNTRFTEEEISTAFERGEQLIWFPTKDAKGNPITMKRLYEHLENEAPLGGKLLCDTGWYQEEPFFTTETARSDESGLGSWCLVGTAAIPETKGGNYLQQTVIGAEYVRDTVFGSNPPESLRKVLAETAEREEEIAAVISKNWKQGAEILSGLPFNRMFREPTIEALIRVVANQQANKVRLLENEYSWTNSRSRGGRLVNFGGAGAGGAVLGRWDPQFADGGFGLFLSRSDTVGSE